MPETEITELDELTAEKVSGVASPANGTPFLVLKAQAPPEPDGDSEEADAIEDTVTKRKLKAKDRKKLPKSDFAVPEKAPASGSYPIPDASHARNALARASGKPVEARVKAAVHRKFPQIGQEEAAKDGSPGVPAFATATPREAGHDASMSQSGLGGPATGAKRRKPRSDSRAEGGASAYTIRDERKVPKEPKPVNAAKTEAGVTVIASLLEAIDMLAAQRAVKASGSLSVANVDPDDDDDNDLTPATDTDHDYWTEDGTPTPKGRAAGLGRKEAEALRPVVEKLAAHAFTDDHLRQARDHLRAVLAGVGTTNPGHAGTDEENAIMTTVTKDELATMVASGATAAVKSALKAERKEAKKAARTKRKAAKNANNGGDIDAAGERKGITRTADADDVNAIPDGGHVDAQYLNKQQRREAKLLKATATQLKELSTRMGTVQEQVTAFAGRPRAGGPVLDGRARGAFPASEHRHSEPMTKAAADPEIEKLEKALEVELGKTGPEAAARASDLGQRLTRERLYQAHASGQI